jgi:hypothetical protein
VAAEATDRVAVAYGIAEQLFQSDLRGRKPVEATGEDAFRAWQAFAARSGNRGLYQVLDKLDRCAFAERWATLRAVYLEQGRAGAFAALMHAGTDAAG